MVFSADYPKHFSSTPAALQHHFSLSAAYPQLMTLTNTNSQQYSAVPSSTQQYFCCTFAALLLHFCSTSAAHRCQTFLKTFFKSFQTFFKSFLDINNNSKPVSNIFKCFQTLSPTAYPQLITPGVFIHSVGDIGNASSVSVSVAFRFFFDFSFE